MYCRNCGQLIPDTETVCRYCGTYTAADQYPAQGCGAANPGCGAVNPGYGAANPGYGRNAIDQRAGVRQGEMEELDRMISHFSQKQPQFDEFDQVMRRLDPNNRKKRVGLLVWGIIFCSIALITLIAAYIVYNNSYRSYYDYFGYYRYSSGFSYSTMTAICWTMGLLFLGGLTMIILFIVTSSVRNRNYSNALKRYQELSDELMDHYRAYLNSRGYCLVSPEYTNPHNLGEIYTTIQSGRADTIKEAVNILVEDAHRYNMQVIAKQTAASAAAAASGAKAAAVFSAAGFFRRR